MTKITKGNPLPALADLLTKEADFLALILEFAKLHGWLCAHFRPARTEKGWRTAVQADGQGFPDLILARRGVVICAEIKSEKGKLSDEQREWLTELGSLSVGVWRPSDWQKIVEVLR